MMSSMITANINEDALSCFLPQGTLDFFDIVLVQPGRDTIHLILEEKNNPPLEEKHKNKQLLSKGFKDITVTDFPARNRKVTLTFRRRCWHVEGEKKLLMRDIPLRASGTKLQQEFADFLKGAS
jgi:hypothetical protein